MNDKSKQMPARISNGPGSEPNTPRFPRLVFDVPLESADDASLLLFEMGATGVEVRDAATLDTAAEANVATLLASFPTSEQADIALAQLESSWNPRRDDVIGDEWRDAWKEHFRPFLLTSSIAIHPPWATVEQPEGCHVIVMDPGRAFGTGLHATTRLVAQSLERNAERFAGCDVLDVGCGSGVLALCALVLGARWVRAVDNDPEAVAATLENAQFNGYFPSVQADATDVSRLRQSFPFVVANIESQVLIRMASALKQCLAPGGMLVLSGILKDQADDVVKAYEPLVCTALHEDGGWVALELGFPS